MPLVYTVERSIEYEGDTLYSIWSTESEAMAEAEKLSADVSVCPIEYHVCRWVVGATENHCMFLGRWWEGSFVPHTNP